MVAEEGMERKVKRKVKRRVKRVVWVEKCKLSKMLGKRLGEHFVRNQKMFWNEVQGMRKVIRGMEERGKVVWRRN